MRSISNHNIGIESQIREYATLTHNSTNFKQPNRLAFVQIDDDYAVGSDGSIYQIVKKDDIHEGCTLYYESETSDVVFNYAEDNNQLTDEDDLAIFHHCLTVAEEMI
jgi:hypothetical protein